MPAQRLIRPVGQPAAASDAPDGRKLYQQVAAAVAEAIQRGEFGPGQRIPSERELAEEYKVSRPTIREAMAKVRLGHLADRLDEVDLWGQRLSGGEQQRLAVARALLSKPDWLFLDEATASLDEKLEGEIYATIDRELPQAHIVSIGHRATLREMHDAIVTMEPNEDGTFTPIPTAKAPVA